MCTLTAYVHARSHASSLSRSATQERVLSPSFTASISQRMRTHAHIHTHTPEVRITVIYYIHVHIHTFMCTHAAPNPASDAPTSKKASGLLHFPKGALNRCDGKTHLSSGSICGDQKILSAVYVRMCVCTRVHMCIRVYKRACVCACVGSSCRCTPCMFYKHEVTCTRMNEVTSTRMNEVTRTRMNEVTCTRMNEVTCTRMNEVTRTRMNEVTRTRMNEVTYTMTYAYEAV
jgi:hypothetical protein